MPKTNNLSINVPGITSLQNESRSGFASPHTPNTPHTPLSPQSASNAATGDGKLKSGQYGEGYDNHVNSPINALPPPRSPRSPKLKTSKIFGNKLGSRSTTKLQRTDSPPVMPSRGQTEESTSQVYLSPATNKSSPDIAHSGQSSPDTNSFNPDTIDDRSDSANAKETGQKRKEHKFGNFLNRKSSLRGDETMPPPSANSSNREKAKPSTIRTVPSQTVDMPVRTAPMEKERGFRAAMNSSLRNRSLDRNTASEDEPAPPSSQHAYKPSQLGSNGLPAHTSGSLVSNLRSGGSRAAEGISKAKKGFFGNFKLNRSASSHEKEPIRNEPYELKVLILPLEEQARITRISKRLHYCKDKTEFWLPAFPYRCIDYLSDRGTYSEGLYRVPGSELEIKHYMARFDREYDLDLFDQKDLHDVNVVATMLKRWLSNLPPVLPPETQTDIIRKCSEASPAAPGSSTPEYMKQKLSELPPWNYYLLFAITGHISFLHNHREQNKMTYENLFRCFATRALQVEPYIFWWLVWDWRNCWLGCAKEEEYKSNEYQFLDANEKNGEPIVQKPPGSSTSTRSASKSKVEKRFNASKQAPAPTTRPQTARANSEQREQKEQRNVSSSESSKPSMTTARSVSPAHEEPVTTTTELPMPLLSPLKPLSPIENF